MSCSWRARRTQITSSKSSSWQLLGDSRSCARSGRCTITVRSFPTSEWVPSAVVVLISPSPLARSRRQSLSGAVSGEHVTARFSSTGAIRTRRERRAAVRGCRHDCAVPNAVKLSGFLAVLAAGVLLAWTLSAGSLAADTTTADTAAAVTTTEATDTTTAADETATESGTTVFSTTTVATTTTRIIHLPVTGTTTSASSDEDGTEAWVWVLLAILAVALVALIVLLARRGRGGASAEERRRQLDAAVGSWAAQGWAVESTTPDSAVLRRGNEAMLVSVDRAGHVATQPLPPE